MSTVGLPCNNVVVSSLCFNGPQSIFKIVFFRHASLRMQVHKLNCLLSQITKYSKAPLETSLHMTSFISDRDALCRSSIKYCRYMVVLLLLIKLTKWQQIDYASEGLDLSIDKIRPGSPFYRDRDCLCVTYGWNYGEKSPFWRGTSKNL